MYLIWSMGKKQFVIKNSSNFDHQVRKGRLKTKNINLEARKFLFTTYVQCAFHLGQAHAQSVLYRFKQLHEGIFRSVAAT